MINNNSILNEVIDISKWQQLQDSLALVTNMALITIDYKGNPVTNHSSCSSFCDRVRNHPHLIELCQKCDARGGLEAVRANMPYIYYCHFAIVDIAIPIIVDNQYIGAIMAGQVKLLNLEGHDELEYVFNPKNTTLIQETIEQYRSDYERLPILSYSQIETITEMLNQLSHYIIGEAIDKQLKIQTCMSFMYTNSTQNKIISQDHPQIQSINRVKKEVSNSLLDVLINTSKVHNPILSSTLLQPALEYIHQHKGENITLENVSEVCHISSSYFSRVFKKEIGINFKTYVSKLKINWAKELLESTNIPIGQISDTLGFNDSGYFIKKFKSTYGVTPGDYRDNHNDL